MVKPTKMGSKSKAPPHLTAERALHKAVSAIVASWGATVVAAAVDIADLEAGAPHGAPAKETPLQRAARLANRAMPRAVLPRTVDDARWGARLAFAELPSATRAPPGPKTKLYEIIAGEWAGYARGTPPGEPSPYAAWRAVDADRFRAFFIDAMIANEDGEVGAPDFVERDDVRAVERHFFAALGEAPERCVLAADVARGTLPDGLDFDKAFVAVGRTRVAAVWMYLGRLWG
jgi:hypothetical protein